LPDEHSGKPEAAPAAQEQAQQVEHEARQMVESLRQEGMARARTIIANAEREAQAVIREAAEAATRAEADARERTEAILAGRPLPQADPSATPAARSFSSRGSESRLSPLPSEGPLLRYRVAGPLSFSSMLQLKHEVAHLEGVESASVVPGERGDAVLSLRAADPQHVLSRLEALPSLTSQRSRDR